MSHSVRSDPNDVLAKYGIAAKYKFPGQAPGSPAGTAPATTTPPVDGSGATAADRTEPSALDTPYGVFTRAVHAPASGNARPTQTVMATLASQIQAARQAYVDGNSTIRKANTPGVWQRLNERLYETEDYRGPAANLGALTMGAGMVGGVALAIAANSLVLGSGVALGAFAAALTKWGISPAAVLERRKGPAFTEFVSLDELRPLVAKFHESSDLDKACMGIAAETWLPRLRRAKQIAPDAERELAEMLQQAAGLPEQTRQDARTIVSLFGALYPDRRSDELERANQIVALIDGTREPLRTTLEDMAAQLCFLGGKQGARFKDAEALQVLEALRRDPQTRASERLENLLISWHGQTITPAALDDLQGVLQTFPADGLASAKQAVRHNLFSLGTDALQSDVILDEAGMLKLRRMIS